MHKKLLTRLLIMGLVLVNCQTRSFNYDSSNSTLNSANTAQGIALEVDMGPGQTAVMAFQYLEEKVPSILGAEWFVRPYGSHRIGFLVYLRSGSLSTEQANGAINKLKQNLDAEYLKSIELAVSGQLPSFESYTTATSEFPKYAGLTTRDPEWHLKFMDVFDAWEKLKQDKNRAPGEGILIGQIDTGLLPHPEIMQDATFLPAILWNESSNLVEKKVDRAIDAFTTSGNKPVPSHGTATMSVLVSPRGRQVPGEPASEFVTGISPAATILPIRATTSAVLMGIEQLADVANAVGLARKHGAHIITMSLGGRFDPFLHAAIKNAVNDGVIVIASGGAHTDIEPWPGRYRETITATAGTIQCSPWEADTPGSSNDITVPGVDIWHATSYKRKNGEMLWAVRRGVGTSFSAPILAGAAAIWLSYHGWNNLVNRYGAKNIYKVFLAVLQSPAGHRTCRNINPSTHGAGYLNVNQLLAAPLPTSI